MKLVADGLRLVFWRLTTDSHLTNHKPDFMLELLGGPARDVDALFYIDPDICVNERWEYFEEWVSCGVALCEDMNSPLPSVHPRRVGWRQYFSNYGHLLQFREAAYVNGGYVGVKRENFPFIRLWKDLQLAMSDEIGGLDATKLAGGATYKSKGFANCFESADQDALNAAIEASDVTISVIGKEAMGFRAGSAVLPHAAGRYKPWAKQYLKSALQGIPPTSADRAFWNYVGFPIASFDSGAARYKEFTMKIASLVGRSYRKY
ncbi:MAG: hypothetical protein WA632_06340 [Gallionella sp.]